MAKKRRQKVEKKDEYDFKFPEFDEHQYIDLELRKAKASLIAFIFAILMVVITFQLFTVTYPDARGPMVLGIFAVVGIPIIIKFLKVDTNDFDWKNWLGAGAVYILSWLAIFILVCNPPFSDFIAPEIDKNSLELTYLQSQNSTWTAWDTEIDPPTLTSPVIRINVSVKIKDNSAVDKESIKIIIRGPNNFTRNLKYIRDDKYGLIFSNRDSTPFPIGTYDFSIEAKDAYGHKKVLNGRSFEII